MAFDPYKVLGVSKTANDEEIRKAYKKLVRANHPDVDPSPEAARRFKDVTQAHEILSDAKRRSNYDQFGVTDEAGNWPPPPNSGRGPQSGSPFPFDLEELMGRRGPRPRGPAGGVASEGLVSAMANRSKLTLMFRFDSPPRGAITTCS
jgi:DnaJ-class molecular chaperone